MDPNITLAKTKKVLLSNLEELIKLTALTEGLLKMAQLENGDMPQEDIAVSKLVSDAINSVQTAADAKHVKLSTENETVAVVVGAADRQESPERDRDRERESSVITG